MELFITGTDTDVGKTFVTALLTAALLKKGLKVKVIKLVATGCKGGVSEDTVFIKEATAGIIGRRALEDCRFYDLSCFSFAASPHLAAEKEGRSIEACALMEALAPIRRQEGILLVEGAGGLMVPINRRELIIDVIKGLDMEALLVSRSWLGTINHTLLSIDAMKSRDIRLRAVILNSGGGTGQVPGSYLHPDIIADNRRVISEFGSVPVYGPVPKAPDPGSAFSLVEEELEGILNGLLK